MCFSRNCPAEDYNGECMHHIGPHPCQVAEAFESSWAVTEWLCPDCHLAGNDAALLFLDGVYRCPDCETGWTAEELPRVYSSLLAYLAREKEDAQEACRHEKTQADDLRGVLDRIRQAVAV